MVIRPLTLLTPSKKKKKEALSSEGSGLTLTVSLLLMNLYGSLILYF